MYIAAHDAYICVGQKSYVNEKNRLKYSDKHYFMQPELTELFKDLPDAIENNRNFKYRFSYYPKKTNLFYLILLMIIEILMKS